MDLRNFSREEVMQWLGDAGVQGVSLTDYRILSIRCVSDTMLEGRVENGGQRFGVMVSLRDDRLLTSHCTCEQPFCKHAVAVLLAAASEQPKTRAANPAIRPKTYALIERIRNAFNPGAGDQLAPARRSKFSLIYVLQTRAPEQHEITLYKCTSKHCLSRYPSPQRDQLGQDRLISRRGRSEW